MKINHLIGPAVLITTMYCLITFGTYHNYYYFINCHKTVTVDEITKVEYRDAWAIMSNGETHKFNQPRPALTVGSEHCMDKERVRNDKPLPLYLFWIAPWD
jgi:hypothetical protein